MSRTQKLWATAAAAQVPTPISAASQHRFWIHSRLVTWLGVVIFVAFSLGLSLFFQFDRKRMKARPDVPDLGAWVNVGDAPAGLTLERRTFVVPAGLLRRAQLVQQERHRDPISGEVSWVGPEQVLQRWFEL